MIISWGSHRQLCNKMLLDSKYFLVEKMQFQALQKRAKETKRQEAVSEVRQKNGGIKLIQKFKRKSDSENLLVVVHRQGFCWN